MIMKRVAVSLGLALVLCVGVAQAGPYWQEYQTGSRASLDGLSTSTQSDGGLLGLPLTDLKGVRVNVCGAGAARLAGTASATDAGTIAFWVKDLRSGLWMKVDPELDVSVTVSTKCQTWDFESVVHTGDRVMAQTVGVVIDGGSSLSVSIEGQKTNGR